MIKALGNPLRLNILDLLAKGEYCVCEIFKSLDLPQNLASHHLAILQKSKLITSRRSGKWIYYSLNPASFSSLKKLIVRYGTAKKRIHKSYC